MSRDPDLDRLEDDTRALRDVVRVPKRDSALPASGSRGGPHFEIDKLPAHAESGDSIDGPHPETDSLVHDEDDLEAAYLRALEASDNVADIVAEFEPVDPLLQDDTVLNEPTAFADTTPEIEAVNAALDERTITAPVSESGDASSSLAETAVSGREDRPLPEGGSDTLAASIQPAQHRENPEQEEIPDDTPADTIVWASDEEPEGEPPAAHHELTTAAIAASQSPVGSPGSTGRAAPVVRVGSDVEPANDAATTGKVVHPHQVIEAALFVDGPIPARKICTLLGGSFEPAFVELAVEQLNTSYLNEGRPFEILITDGGYHLQLRREYDFLRHRVFGTGPREVKLGQDLLEVLAIVAYRQPITVDELDGVRKASSAGSLRQLLRRDLVSLERDPENPKRVLYRTTARFLNLFGLGSIDELPRTEDVDTR